MCASMWVCCSCMRVCEWVNHQWSMCVTNLMQRKNKKTMKSNKGILCYGQLDEAFAKLCEIQFYFDRKEKNEISTVTQAIFNSSKYSFMNFRHCAANCILLAPPFEVNVQFDSKPSMNVFVLFFEMFFRALLRCQKSYQKWQIWFRAYMQMKQTTNCSIEWANHDLLDKILNWCVQNKWTPSAGISIKVLSKIFLFPSACWVLTIMAFRCMYCRVNIMQFVCRILCQNKTICGIHCFYSIKKQLNVIDCLWKFTLNIIHVKSRVSAGLIALKGVILIRKTKYVHVNR